MRPKKNTTTSNEAGLTLVEVIVAAAVLAIGILAVIRWFPTAIDLLRQANQRTVSASIADTELGRVRVGSAEALLDRYYFSPSSAIESVYEINDIYAGFVKTVAPMRGSNETFLQRVTFNVTLPDGSEEVYVTYVTRQ